MPPVPIAVLLVVVTVEFPVDLPLPVLTVELPLPELPVVKVPVVKLPVAVVTFEPLVVVTSEPVETDEPVDCDPLESVPEPEVVRPEDPPVGPSAARRAVAAREPAVLAVPAPRGNASVLA